MKQNNWRLHWGAWIVTVTLISLVFAAVRNAKGAKPGQISIHPTSFSSNNPPLFPGLYSDLGPGIGQAVFADFNRDGILDAAAGNSESFGRTKRSIYIGLGLGNGGFELTKQIIDVRPVPLHLAAGDVTGDGLIDLVLPDAGIQVFPGDGAGSFGPGIRYAGGGSDWIALADLNGDSILDVIVTNPPDDVSVYLSTPTGLQFEMRIKPPTGFVSLIAIADLNGDGRSDFVVGLDRRVASYLNQGNGRFGEGIISPALIDYFLSKQMSLVDVTKDGRPDVVIDGVLQAGRGDGSFAPAYQQLIESRGITWFSDLNGDGILDIVSGPYEASVWLGAAEGGFVLKQRLSGLQLDIAALGDFNGDGIVDIRCGFHGAVFLEGVGDGTFHSWKIASDRETKAPTLLAAGDVNSDGRPDLLTAGGTGDAINVRMAQPDGTYTTQRVGVVTGAVGLAPADLNVDGNLDMLAASAGRRAVIMALGNGDGTFGISSATAVPEPSGIAVDDFNKDGFLDLAVVSASASNLSILLGTGVGSLNAPKIMALTRPAVTVRSGDLHGDGTIDLVLTAKPQTTNDATTLAGCWRTSQNVEI
jgi:hypothetical protein